MLGRTARDWGHYRRLMRFSRLTGAPWPRKPKGPDGRVLPRDGAVSDDAPDEASVSPETAPAAAQEGAETPQSSDTDGDTDEDTVMTREAAMGMTIAHLKAHAAEHDLPEPKGQKAVIVDALAAAGLVVEPFDGAQDEE